MSKGAWRRPRKVDHEKFEAAWDKVFGSGGYQRDEPMSAVTGEYQPTPVPSAEGSEEEPGTSD